VGRIAAEDLLPLLAARHANVSVSHLEDLAQCRFRFFAGKTLGLKTRPERPQERLQARMTGLILHHALERWLEEGRGSDFVPYFEAAFEEMCRKEHLPEGYRLELERIESRRIAEKVSATEKWSAISHEVEVPISIGFPGGVTVNGRIDRVDRLNETDCIVVDYKSGKTKNVEKFAVSPLKLQGPLYALALRDTRGLNTVVMMFHAVRDDKRFGWGVVPGSDIELQPIPERWMEDAKERTVERLTGFLAGEVRAEPVDRSQCRWCDFAAACRYEEREALVMIEGAGN
jgi:ATP-dependent helicase/DNAse subunit B